ncbi:hypothetical protein BDZ97DRAFT_1820116 [Flammula alnicola]|nr:hypothetical protein BDZ97DRAFT_1820116 [Flammula alnicola]
MPTTPKDDFESIASTTTLVSGSKKRVYDKEKSLPPLPAGGLKKTPSNSSRTEGVGSGSAAAAATGKYAFPRARTFSSASSASASTPLSPSAVLSSLPSPSVRPLQLPRQAARVGGDRPAVPVPSVLSTSASRSSLRTPSLTSANRSPPLSPLPSPGVPTGIARPKPRTGTGMVYRTSSSSLGSKMRPPMALSSSVLGSNSISSGAGGGSIGRATGIARPIAL